MAHVFSFLFRKITIDRSNRLGEGGYGSVFLGKLDGKEVAVKRVELHNVNENEEEALKKLDHPNVIKLLHSKSDDDFKYFAMELCEASLDQLFLKPDHPRKYKGPALPPHLIVFLQLASGLEYIHLKKLIHRDIKPENILIFVDSTTGLVTIKWADFGLSKIVNERGTCELSGIKGTNNWLAPELLRKLHSKQLGRGNTKSDVFSFALVIGYLLLDGQHLYGSDCDIHTNIKKQDPINMNNTDRSHYARDLLTKMLKDEPGERISSEEVVKELQSIKIEKEEEFRELCKNENLDFNKIKFLIENGIDVNGKNEFGWNALHFLCWNNSSEKLIDLILLLIQNGIDVNGKDIIRRNALHLLCWYNSSEKIIDAMKFLIQNGIDVNEKENIEGKNALHWLCSDNSSEKLIDAMQLLIENGINVNEKDNYGRNALHFLCWNNLSEKLIDGIRFLIENGIDVNEKDNNYGRNALHLLCRFNSSEKLIDAIKLLIENGIDVNEKDERGWNGLHFLCQFNSSEKLIDAIQFLLEHGIQSKGIDARSLLRENYRYRTKTEAIEKIIHLLGRTSIGK